MVEFGTSQSKIPTGKLTNYTIMDRFRHFADDREKSMFISIMIDLLVQPAQHICNVGGPIFGFRFHYSECPFHLAILCSKTPSRGFSILKFKISLKIICSHLKIAPTNLKIHMAKTYELQNTICQKCNMNHMNNWHALRTLKHNTHKHRRIPKS